MKKLITLLAAVVALSSCNVLVRQYRQKSFTLDFREYSDAGFIITPSTTGFKYSPVGEVSIEFYPGVKEGYFASSITKLKPIGATTDDLYYTPPKEQNQKKGDWFEPSSDYMVREFVSCVKGINGTGVMNFKAETVYNYSGNIMVFEKYVLSGFAVKIIE